MKLPFSALPHLIFSLSSLPLLPFALVLPASQLSSSRSLLGSHFDPSVSAENTGIGFLIKNRTVIILTWAVWSIPGKSWFLYYWEFVWAESQQKGDRHWQERPSPGTILGYQNERGLLLERRDIKRIWKSQDWALPWMMAVVFLVCCRTLTETAPWSRDFYNTDRILGLGKKPWVIYRTIFYQ